MNENYRIRFNKGISDEHIEQRLLLAALNTENVFGEAVMRLDASFRFDRKSKVCLIDRGTEVGRHIRLFIAYISKSSEMTVTRSNTRLILSYSCGDKLMQERNQNQAERFLDYFSRLKDENLNDAFRF